MQDNSSLADLFTAGQQEQAAVILAGSQVALISCLYWQMDIPQVIPFRRLGDSLLYIPVSGRLRCTVGHHEKLLGPGDVLMVPEGIEHEARLAPDCDYFEAYAVHAHAYTTHGRPLFHIFTSPFGYCRPAETWLEQLATLTHLMGRNPALGRQFGEPWLRSLLLHQVAQGLPIKKKPTMDDPRLWQSVCHILNNYDTHLTISDLARQAGLSEGHFRRLFQRYTGLAPKAYIQQLRLRKARLLLQTNPQLTVKEAANMTGFNDPHYLHAVFKATYGMSPGDCRKAADTANSAED